MERPRCPVRLRPEGRKLVDETVVMLTTPFHDIDIGVTTENVARKHDLSRQSQDEFAVESQRWAVSEAARAAFAVDITPVEVGGRKPITATEDEHPKQEMTTVTLTHLGPASDGSATAGNASGINDAAAVLVLAQELAAAERGLTGLVSPEGVTTAAMELELMACALVLAVDALSGKTRTSLADIDTVDVSQMLAFQAVAATRDAKLDPEKVAPYSGAVPLGDPVGATGTTLVLRVAKDLVRRDPEFDVVTMCSGGGHSLPALFCQVS